LLGGAKITMWNEIRGLCAALLLMAPVALTQQPESLAKPQPPAVPAEKPRPTYVLGAGDHIVVSALEVPEIGGGPVRIDPEGYVNLPLVGRIKASGLTLEQFEVALAERLKVHIRSPEVVVNLSESAKQALGESPVFVLGAFKSPGLYPLQGQPRLTELLSRVGGLQPNAGRRIKITRRAEQGRIPLPNAVDEQDGKASSVEVSINTLMETLNPAEDLTLKPFDVLSLPKVELVYVTGDLQKTGAFPLDDREYLSITQVVALAGGLGPDAAPRKARVLRPVLNSAKRSEIPVDLKRILEGKANDFPLLPNDVLLVPRSGKSGLKRLFWVAVPAVVVSSIYVLIRNR